jgi:hypothetical protein
MFVQEVAMSGNEIIPAFDPALQPIGYALASEMLASDDAPDLRGLGVPVPDRPPVRDMFGWELARPAA